MAAWCAIEAFSTTCAVPIEDSEGYWLSGGCSSVHGLGGGRSLGTRLDRAHAGAWLKSGVLV